MTLYVILNVIVSNLFQLFENPLFDPGVALMRMQTMQLFGQFSILIKLANVCHVYQTSMQSESGYFWYQDRVSQSDFDRRERGTGAENVANCEQT